MKKTNIAVLILLVMVICAMAVFTACETTQEENSPVEYTVTFDSNGGSAVKAQTVEQGKKVVLPAEPTKDNCDFIGWYTEDNKPYDFDSAVNSSFTLYAKWQEIKPAVTYTVTFDANGGSAVKSQEVEEGGKATMPEEPYYEGYDFVGWYTDEDTLYDFNTEVCANLTLTAKWSSKVTVEEIKYNDLNEFFTNLSETELDNFKTSLSNAILNNNVISSRTLAMMFGSGISINELGIYKVAFNSSEEGYSKLQCIVQQVVEGEGVKYVTCDLTLTNAIEKDDFGKTLYSGKFTNVEKNGDTVTQIAYIDKTGEEKTITAGDGILIYEIEADKSYSVVNFKDSLNLINSTNCTSSTESISCSFTIPTQEQKDLFNLLMPYAVSEKEMFSHITVSYTKGTTAGYDWAYTFKVDGYNEDKNEKESRYIVVEAYDTGASMQSDVENALNKGDWKQTSFTNQQMISGDIILNLENEDEYITINPIQ